MNQSSFLEKRTVDAELTGRHFDQGDAGWLIIDRIVCSDQNASANAGFEGID
ncbi:MAG: hypothetical protein IIC60_11410 [Proteobacteria bacterium]|nr:hypothetical protein [Pseudomonadota bacterium]